jgi:tRNA(Ile)-lysidine synthase
MGTASAGPFDAIDFAGRQRVLAAVSGGGDSLALLVLLAEHLARHHPRIELHAATVDHALRAASRGEAEHVARLCADMGIGHAILTWRRDPGARISQETAREARYRLLADHAAALGTDLVVTGHNRDDQAETVLMRSRRADGRGLAGMAPAALFDWRVWIGRPLLAMSRVQLRSVLADRGLGWIDDPSNSDPRHERVRVRAELSSDAPLGLRMLARAEEERRVRVRRVRAAATWLSAHAHRPMPGLVALDFGALSADDGATAALRLAMACMGGRSGVPNADRVETLVAKLGASARRGTLSGCVAERRRETLWLHREARNLPPPVPLFPGSRLDWDGRFRVCVASSAAEGLTIAPLGAADMQPDDAAGRDVPPALARAAWSGMPGITMAEAGPIAADSEEARALGIGVAARLAPYALFLPLFDLETADALAVLLGAARPPRSPFRKHIGAYA